MYLVSIYFDEKTNEKINQYIEQAAEGTGNTFMIEGNVPPHITVGAFESKASEEELVNILQPVVEGMQTEVVQLVSIGTFQTSSIFISAVYSEYLHEMCKSVCEAFGNVENTLVRKNYQPFNWLPHVTIGKTLSREQQLSAFEVLQQNFRVMEAKVVRVGLSKTNPYMDICRWSLDE